MPPLGVLKRAALPHLVFSLNNYSQNVSTCALGLFLVWFFYKFSLRRVYVTSSGAIEIHSHITRLWQFDTSTSTASSSILHQLRLCHKEHSWETSGRNLMWSPRAVSVDLTFLKTAFMKADLQRTAATTHLYWRWHQINTGILNKWNVLTDRMRNILWTADGSINPLNGLPLCPVIIFINLGR